MDKSIHTGPRPVQRTKHSLVCSHIQKTLQYLVFGVETWVCSPRNTNYTTENGQASVLATAGERQGIRLVVDLKANSKDRVGIVAEDSIECIGTLQSSQHRLA